RRRWRRKRRRRWRCKDEEGEGSVCGRCDALWALCDLRSSQVCELGLLNYKAKNVFYPFHTNKFRCRYDYYWGFSFK
ncbi:hypothetical protein CFP56_018816, partial [Quercus suber]